MVSELLCILISVYDFMTVAIDIINNGGKSLNSLKDKTGLTSRVHLYQISGSDLEM